MPLAEELKELKRIVSLMEGGSPLEAGGATEATLQQVRDYLDTVETKLQAIKDALPLSPETGLAKDTTLIEVSGRVLDVKTAVQEVRDRLEVLSDKEFRFDPNTDAPVYIGLNTQGALTSATNWKIFKFEATRIQTKIGSWDSRGTLF